MQRQSCRLSMAAYLLSRSGFLTNTGLLRAHALRISMRLARSFAGPTLGTFKTSTPFVKSADYRKFVLELIDKLQATGEGVNALRLGEDVIAKTVCRHAVKANDSLREEELQGLVDNLRRCEMPYTCPHGRPTLIEMSYPDLEKKFGRIQ